MDVFSLVAAHMPECNRFTYEPRDEHVAALKAVARRARWHRYRSKIAALLRWQSDAPDGSPKLAAAARVP
jgi:hypothetical protein